MLAPATVAAVSVYRSRASGGSRFDFPFVIMALINQNIVTRGNFPYDDEALHSATP